ncbi:MAG TPA: hypothetical protein VHX16_14230 [Chloroflexota bacterium]|jgi:hypothetical protein|nr:hypothetical protein [Chloroflexota bacterium]
MTVSGGPRSWLRTLGRPFRIIVCDWDGTAVDNRSADATAVRERIDTLLQFGISFVVVTGTHFENIDRQLTSGISGRQKSRLFLCTNRGSEVWTWQHGQPVRTYLRSATPEEEVALTRAADDVRDWLELHDGLSVQVVYDRLNRRKIDLIPIPDWQDPPKSAIGALRMATEARLTRAGISGGLAEVIDHARAAAQRAGLSDPRITSDAKHVEIGLTDKSDSMDWILRELAIPRDIATRDILVAGDEFGEVAASPGSDSLLMTKSADGAVFVTVGPEPYGVPPGVIHLAGGPRRFLDLLDSQIQLRRSEDQ